MKGWYYQLLLRILGSWNSYRLWIEILIGRFTLENYLRYLWKLNICNSLYFGSNSIPRWMFSGNVFICAPEVTCLDSHSSTISHSEKWKQFTNLWCTHKVYSHCNREEWASHTLCGWVSKIQCWAKKLYTKEHSSVTSFIEDLESFHVRSQECGYLSGKDLREASRILQCSKLLNFCTWVCSLWKCTVLKICGTVFCIYYRELRKKRARPGWESNTMRRQW
jgi:hypothetical protein